VKEWEYLLDWFYKQDFSAEPLAHIFIPWSGQLGKRLSLVWGALFSNYRSDVKAKGLTYESAT